MMKDRKAASKFEKIVSKLRPEQARSVKKWLKSCNNISDVTTKEIGERVIDNLHHEEQFEDKPFTVFILKLGREHLLSEEASDSYKKACRASRLEGPEASIDKQITLHRIIKRKTFSRELAEANDWPVDEDDDFYSILIDELMTVENADRLAMLEKIQLALSGEIVWCAFDQDDPDSDPILNRTASEVKNLLGLDRKDYPDGEPLIRVKYKPPASVQRKVPTVADAGWYKFWMPAPYGTGYGLTRDLSGNIPVPGRGEVVHENGSMKWMIPPYIPDDIPEY